MDGNPLVLPANVRHPIVLTLLMYGNPQVRKPINPATANVRQPNGTVC